MALGQGEVDDVAGARLDVAGHAGLNLAEGLLILLHVLCQGVEQLLGVFGGHDDAALYACLGHVGGHEYHVDKEVVGPVGDHCQVGIFALHFIGRHFDLDLLLVVVVSHFLVMLMLLLSKI